MANKTGRIVVAKVKFYKKTASALLTIPSNKIVFDFSAFFVKVYKTVICEFIKSKFVNKIVIHIDSGISDRRAFDVALRQFSIQFARHPYIQAGNKIKVFLY